MAIKQIKTESIGQSGVTPRIVYISTDDTLATVTASGYLTSQVGQKYGIKDSDVILITTKSSPSAVESEVSWLKATYSGGDWTLGATTEPVPSSSVPYSLLAGSTDGTNVPQSLPSLGTATQVLTSNGAATLPTWEDAAGGGGVDGFCFGVDVENDGTNNYIVPKSGRALTTSGVNVDYIYYLPIYCPEDTYTRIGLEVTGAAAASSTARLGIYEMGDGGAPGALVVDAGTVAIDSTGIKEIIISEELSGWYYVAYIVDNASGSFRRFSADYETFQTFGMPTLTSGVTRLLEKLDAGEHTALSDPALSNLAGSVSASFLILLFLRVA